MADQEVIKHTKKVVNIWKNKEHGFWHKLKDFVLEILIIVFAVSLSIWLHSRSEHKHQEADVKEFLLGLKQDLASDTLEMNADKRSYDSSSKIFTYLLKLKINDPVNLDTLKKYSRYMFNSTGLVPNNGRFEGFKSSGKIGTIENKVLQNDIMDLYQENIPLLLVSTNYYSLHKAAMIDFYSRSLKRLTDSTFSEQQVWKMDEARNRSSMLTDVWEIIERYNACIKKIRKIIAEIDQEYDTK